MPSLEYIQYSSTRPVIQGQSVQWVPERHYKPIVKLPQIFWSDGDSWTEVNIWALDLAQSSTSVKTVVSNMQGLLTYAKWLETEGVSWWHFPQRPHERCLNRYRGALIDARERGFLAPSTVSNRMSVVIRFYRWVQHQGLLEPENPMWRDRTVHLKISDTVGFERTMAITTTDLSIPNRKPAGILQLEGGLMPVTLNQRSEILKFARQH